MASTQSIQFLACFCHGVVAKNDLYDDYQY